MFGPSSSSLSYSGSGLLNFILFKTLIVIYKKNLDYLHLEDQNLFETEGTKTKIKVNLRELGKNQNTYKVHTVVVNMQVLHMRCPV